MVQKRVIIVGASSGIGREFVLEYVALGYLVGIIARRTYLLIELKNAFPGKVLGSSFDVNDEDVQQKLSQLIEELGGMDLFIYNAGYGKPVTEFNHENEERTVQTNVVGFLRTVNFAFSYFLRQGNGQIAVISSVAALRGNALTPAYSASKSFMSRYAEGLNMKAAKSGKKIFVTDIRPGFMDTKPSEVKGRFWIANQKKAAKQIIRAIEEKKRIAYITKRWWLIAQLLKLVPYNLYRRLV